MNAKKISNSDFTALIPVLVQSIVVPTVTKGFILKETGQGQTCQVTIYVGPAVMSILGSG